MCRGNNSLTLEVIEAESLEAKNALHETIPIGDSLRINDSTFADSDSSHDDHSETLCIPSVRKPDAPMKKCVCFSKLEIKTFPVILGDNPACSFGPPVSYVLFLVDLPLF